MIKSDPKVKSGGRYSYFWREELLSVFF